MVRAATGEVTGPRWQGAGASQESYTNKASNEPSCPPRATSPCPAPSQRRCPAPRPSTRGPAARCPCSLLSTHRLQAEDAIPCCPLTTTDSPLKLCPAGSAPGPSPRPTCRVPLPTIRALKGVPWLRPAACWLCLRRDASGDEKGFPHGGRCADCKGEAGRALWSRVTCPLTL